MLKTWCLGNEARDRVYAAAKVKNTGFERTQAPSDAAGGIYFGGGVSPAGGAAPLVQAL